MELNVARAWHRFGSDALANGVRAIHSGAVRPDDLEALEVKLLSELSDSPRLAEVTFTRASVLGYDDQGEARLDATGRFQISAFRRPDGELRTVSLMFTDIEGFTTLSERLPPDQLARHLGCRRGDIGHDRQVHRRCGDGILECPLGGRAACSLRL